MIPIKLELKNFLCYGDQLQTINFNNYSLICLSGKNGHGKSALLDAMTWALWGQARKVTEASKADEGLLRLGQTRMMVSFEFEIGNKVYRARREYAKTYGKPYAAVDFEAYDNNNKKFVSLTDKTIRKTQTKIETTIGLDFETFINSSFLKQGQSNEFSKKTPKERKQVLANILGLAKYDVMQQKALEKAKEFSDEKKLLLNMQQHFEKQLEHEPEIENLHKQAQQKSITIAKIILQHERDFKELENKQRIIQEQEKKLLLLKTQTYETKKTADSKINALQLLRTTWKSVHKKILGMSNPQKLEAEKKKLTTAQQEYLTQQQKSLTIHEKLLKAQEKLQLYVQTLKTEHDAQLQKIVFERQKLQAELSMLLKQQKNDLADYKNTQDNITQATKKQKELAKHINKKKNLKATFTKTKEQFDKRRIYYQTWIQQANTLTRELKQLEEKTQFAEHETSPSCPLCEQVLTQKRKKFLHQQFLKQKVMVANRLQKLSSIIKKLKKLLITQHEDIQKLQAATADFETITAQNNSLGEQLVQLNDKARALSTKKQTLEKEVLNKQKNLEQTKQTCDKLKKAVLEKPTSDTIYQSINKDVEKLSQEKDAIKLDRSAYEAIVKKLNTLDQKIRECNQLHEEKQQQEQRKGDIRQLCSELKSLKEQLYKLAIEQKNSTVDVTAKTKLIEQQSNVQVTLQTNKKAKEKTLQELGKLKQQLAHLKQITATYKENIKKRNIIDDEIEDYQALAKAFSKNGIQALLIEQAIPEIEEEANQLLAKLTNNQSQIFIESLRDLKSGGVKETLVIKIADTAGIRPYEMFSGGEAFRIDFALRIAISKLLARRMGTALQTLIIDEGFGSQDEEGLARLMHAIHTIQHDFSKVIIVSHLNEFKDNFPVHFQVEKTATGSVIHIEQRG